MRFTRHFILTAVSLSVLLNCSPSSDSSLAPAPVDESPIGVWEGSLTYAGSGNLRTLIAIIAPDGKFAAAISSTTGTTNGRMNTGTGTISGNQLTATGTGIATVAYPAGPLVVPVNFTGTVVSRGAINGAYSGGGESGSYSIAYKSLTDRTSSLATVGGTYTGIAGISNPNIVVNSNNGVLTINTLACAGVGTIAVIDATKNMYSWTAQITSNGGTCAIVGNFTGLAYLSDTSTTITNNVLVMFGSQPGAGALAPSAFFFVGGK